MKIFWKNNVLAIIIVVLMLLISVGSAITIKFGEDATGQDWFGGGDTLITNSNGKAWAPTGTNLQSAIYDLNGTEGQIDIYGDITLSQQIRFGNNNTILDFHWNTITLGSDIICFNVTQKSHIYIKNVDIHTSALHTKPIIELFIPSGASGSDATNRYNLFENIYINQVTSTEHNYTGISLRVDGDGDCFRNTFRNINMRKCGVGINLSVNDLSGWINDNSFEDIFVHQFVKGIVFNSTSGSDGINYNMFNNIQFQTSDFTTNGIYEIEDTGNMFFGCIVIDWALATYPEFPWSINEDGTNTQIVGSDVYSVEGINDKGTFTLTLSGGLRGINLTYINRYSKDTDNVYFNYETTGNPDVYFYGDDGGSLKYAKMGIAAAGHFRIQHGTGLQTIYLTDTGQIWLDNLGTSDIKCFGSCGAGDNFDFQVYGDKAVGSDTGSVNISYGDGVNDYGKIEATNGVRIDDLILDTAIPSAPVDGSCYFNAVNQSFAIYYDSVWRYYEPS